MALSFLSTSIFGSENYGVYVDDIKALSQSKLMSCDQFLDEVKNLQERQVNLDKRYQDQSSAYLNHYIFNNNKFNPCWFVRHQNILNGSDMMNRSFYDVTVQESFRYMNTMKSYQLKNNIDPEENLYLTNRHGNFIDGSKFQYNETTNQLLFENQLTDNHEMVLIYYRPAGELDYLRTLFGQEVTVYTLDYLNLVFKKYGNNLPEFRCQLQKSGRFAVSVWGENLTSFFYADKDIESLQKNLCSRSN